MESIVDEHNEPTNPISVINVLLLLIIIDFIIIFRDFYSSFSQIPKFLSNVISYVCGVCADYRCYSTEKLCIRVNESQTLPQNMEMVTDKLNAYLTQSTHHDNKNIDDDELTIGEVTMVMGKLGISYTPDGDCKFEEKLQSNEISTLFEEQEPSLQEFQEAFSMFDENNDGFIDYNELRKVVSTLCLSQASEVECRRMIKAFDNNGDGVIDFDEFVRLLTNSFC
ncbi:probable calcium-binding protein CML46 [Mercurialis annua]|uniref:probable calcium-binding protein CML46 n=1 Tax=Mercurialis annua TaxID=3986 RepID=UPI002160C366|nr:probable calcium-binding protein CML46 [Mercurialis annua]